MTCGAHKPPLPFCPRCYSAHAVASPPLCEDGNERLEEEVEREGESWFWGLAAGAEDNYVAITADWGDALAWHCPGERRWAVRLSARQREASDAA